MGVKYQYEYVVYDGFRSQLVGNLKRVASDKELDAPFPIGLEFSAKADTLVLNTGPSSIIRAGKLTWEAIPQQDSEKIFFEAFFELSKEEVQRFLTNWRFIEIKRPPIGRIQLSDLATLWESAPQREPERKLAEEARLKTREQNKRDRLHRIKNALLNLPFIALFVIAVGCLIMAFIYPPINTFFNTVASLASVLSCLLAIYAYRKDARIPSRTSKK